MARRFVTALCLLAAALCALPAVAPAKKKKSKSPKITLVSPMRGKVGRNLTLRGKNFSRKRRRNTIVFRGPGGRAAFAKPRRARSRKLVVKVPRSVERLLAGSGKKATRIKLRVLVRRRAGKYTRKRNTPLILSSGVVQSACRGGYDDDGDLLSKGSEARLKTDPCDADTDTDGVEDGFEQESARDLNQRATPYPGKRPYPNALFPDAHRDYDGDGLTNKEEFAAWKHAPVTNPTSLLQGYSTSGGAPVFRGRYGGPATFGAHDLPLNYSDGDQTTVFVSGGHPEYRWYLDMDQDGVLTDDERDVDGDGLGNTNELRLLVYEKHYDGLDPDECPYKYEPWLPRDFLQPSYTDWDSDGDGISDGNDDQDNDDVSNVDEVVPPYRNCGDPPDDVGPFPWRGTRDGADRLRQPFNPCLPYRSRACARYGPR